MLIKCASTVKVGDEQILFPFRLDQNNIQLLSGQSTHRFKARIKAISSVLTQEAAVDLDEADQEYVFTMPEQKLRLTVDFPDMPSNAVEFQIRNFDDNTMAKLKEKIDSHQRLKINTKYAFLDERPFLGIALHGKEYQLFLVLPPKASYLCDYPEFFRLLGFVDQVQAIDVAGNGKLWYGFHNEDGVHPRTLHSDGLDISFGETMGIFANRTLGEDMDAPSNINLLVIMEDYQREVTFNPGLGRFQDYFMRFKEVFEEQLKLLNIVANKVIIAADEDRIRLIHHKSPNEIFFTLKIELESEFLPIEFETGKNVIDFDQDEHVFSKKWTMPEIPRKIGRRRGSGMRLEDSFPLTVVKSGGSGPLGYVHGAGLLHVAAMIDRRGRPQAEYFDLPSLQCPLVLYFINNDGTVFNFSQAMTVYLTLHVL
jgi:hypothetical protein